MQNVILDGGLDLTTARPATLPGRIRECLNFEANGWQRGYSRIDGFERFDGHTSPSTTTGWAFSIAYTDIGGILGPGYPMSWSDAEGNTVENGAVLVDIDIVDFTVAHLWIVFRTGRGRPQAGDYMFAGAELEGGGFQIDNITAGTLKTFPEYYADHGSYLSALDGFAATLRNNVQAVPGTGHIVGLHYHEDQLYAIRDATRINVGDPLDIPNLAVGMYVVSAAGQPGEVVEVDDDADAVEVVPLDGSGFDATPASGVAIAQVIRFNTGLGDGFPGPTTVVCGTSGWAGSFSYRDVREGSWGGHTASGIMLLTSPTDTTAMIPGEVLSAVTGYASVVVEEVLQVYEIAAITVGSVATGSVHASMWRSTDEGWEPATSTRTLAFNSGQNDPTGAPIGTSTGALEASAAGYYASGGYTAVDWTGTWSDVTGPPDNVTITCPPFVDGYGTMHRSDKLYVKGFGATLLDSDVVTGVAVTFRGQNTVPAASCGFSCGHLLGGNGYSAPVLETGSNDPTVAGGDGLPWGVELTPAVVNDSEYGFWVSAYNGSQTVGLVYLDNVEIEIFYEYVPGEKLYIYDPAIGVDAGYIRVDSTIVTEGDWVSNDAAGYFRVTDWSALSFPAGSEVRTAVAGGGALVALASGPITAPDLPGSRALTENNSKYQMISYNFFASEDRNAIYGVSGAGLAFWYDGTTLDSIATGVGATDGTSGDPAAGVEAIADKPRHLAPHENRLALGYGWGEVYLSGPDPLDFSAATGLAASFGFGDKITGMSPAPGKALAVFTESTTNVLIGAPSAFGVEALAGVEQQVVNPKVGAIEYTVQNMGNAPIFASFRGIETLETMDQYSDFFTAPLTHDVSPWLLERLQAAVGVEGANKSVVNSVVVRNKNQYRLFFADGYVLTLTYVGREKEPQLTKQQYWFDDDREAYALCYATASGVGSDGRDHAFFSVGERSSTDGLPAMGDVMDFVYEMDRGRSFDGDEIEAAFTLTHYYSKSADGGPAPSKAHRFNCFQMHGTCAGTADLHVSRSINYEDLDAPVQGAEPIPFYDSTLPAQDAASAKYTKGRINARGFAVSVHVSHRSKLEFAPALQMITFLNDTELKEDR